MFEREGEAEDLQPQLSAHDLIDSTLSCLVLGKPRRQPTTSISNRQSLDKGRKCNLDDRVF